MKKLIWVIFIFLLLGMGFQAHVLEYATNTQYTILDLEVANKAEGQAILSSWSKVSYGEGTMLDVAKSNTHWDFLFIFCYVSLLLLHSNEQMQREKVFWLNALLRLNLLLALLAGLLDIGENLALLHDFRHVSDGRYYLETLPVTLPKFAFAFFALLVFLVSWLKSVWLGWFRADQETRSDRTPVLVGVDQT
jgi:Mg2+/citrate symporter